MSEILTRITLPEGRPFVGMMDWGRRSTAEMIQMARTHAKAMRAEAKAIEDACDSDFQVDIIRGPHRQRLLKTLQQSTRSRT